jgi:flagellar biogenesis protein FliO
MLQLLLIESPAARPQGGPELTQYFVVCLGLIAFVLIAAWAFKRLFAGSFAARAARRSLQVVDVLPLGGKQRLAVVRCYERTFVVGLGDKELCLVAELDAQSTPELAGAPEAPLPTLADRSAFQRLLGKVAPRAPRAQRAEGRAARREGALSPEGVLG